MAKVKTSTAGGGKGSSGKKSSKTGRVNNKNKAGKSSNKNKTGKNSNKKNGGKKNGGGKITVPNTPAKKKSATSSQASVSEEMTPLSRSTSAIDNARALANRTNAADGASARYQDLVDVAEEQTPQFDTSSSSKGMTMRSLGSGSGSSDADADTSTTQAASGGTSLGNSEFAAEMARILSAIRQGAASTDGVWDSLSNLKKMSTLGRASDNVENGTTSTVADETSNLEALQKLAQAVNQGGVPVADSMSPEQLAMIYRMQNQENPLQDDFTSGKANVLSRNKGLAKLIDNDDLKAEKYANRIGKRVGKSTKKAGKYAGEQTSSTETVDSDAIDDLVKNLLAKTGISKG